jgi:hypothetical protein
MQLQAGYSKNQLPGKLADRDVADALEQSDKMTPKQVDFDRHTIIGFIIS